MSQEAIFRQVQEKFLLPQNFFDTEEIDADIDAVPESMSLEPVTTVPVRKPVTFSKRIRKQVTISKQTKYKKPEFRYYVGSVAYRIKQMLTDLSYSVNSQEEFSELMNSQDLDLTRMFITREYKKNPEEFCDTLEAMGMLVANCNATSTLVILVAGRNLTLRYRPSTHANVARPQRNP